MWRRWVRRCGDVVARHEVLRTVYPETADGPVQVILPPGEAVPEVAVVRVAEAELIGRGSAAFLSGPFDVTAEVPLRVGVFELSAVGVRAGGGGASHFR